MFPGDELGRERVCVCVCGGGGMPPRSKCSVVDPANVPHDHKGRGASRWIAIRGSYRYAGRGGVGKLREM